MNDEAKCPICGAPYELKRKWNGGNPAMFYFSTCTCEEDELFERLDDILARRRDDIRPPGQ